MNKCTQPGQEANIHIYPALNLFTVSCFPVRNKLWDRNRVLIIFFPVNYFVISSIMLPHLTSTYICLRIYVMGQRFLQHIYSNGFLSPW